jgi:hypothetical protein
MDAHKNFAYGTIATAPTPATSGTSLTLATGIAARMPATPFNATVWPTAEIAVASNAEIIRVTNITGDVATIVRAQEGTTARTIIAGDQIAATITAKTLTDVETAIPSTAGLISAINVSGGTTSNNLSAITFSNANGVSFGLAGSVVTGTVATNYQSPGAYLTTAMQSNAVTLSNAKLSAGTLSALRSDVTFGDSNGISFGLNTNGVLTGTVATNYQSAGAYLTTADLSQNSSKYAATGFTTTTIAGSVVAGTHDTNGLKLAVPAFLTVAAGGNASLNVSAGTTSNNLTNITFANSNGVSFGLNASTITATVATNYQSQGAYLTTADLSQNSSKYAATGFTTTTIAGSVVAGTHDTNGLKLAVPAFLTVAAGGNASLNISAGTTSNNLTNVTFANSNGVSFGLNASTITATVATNYQSQGAYLTTAALSGDTSKYVQEWALTGNTSGTTSSAQGSRLFLSGGQGLTISGSSNSLVFSVGSYITTGALSQDSSKYAGTGFTTTTAAGAAVAGTHDTSGLKLAVPAYLTTAMQSNAVTLSNINLSAGTTSNLASAFTFANSNGVSFGLNASTITATVKTDYQSAGAYLTTAALSQDSSKYAATGFTTTTVAGAVIAGTQDTNGLKLAVPAFLTTALGSAASTNFVQATAAFAGTNASGTIASNGISISVAAPGAGGAVQVSAGTTSNNLTNLVFADSNGVAFGLNGSTITASATPASATTVFPVASANSVGTVTRWAAEDHAHAGLGGIGVSTAGNVAGTTGSIVGTYWLQGGNNVTLSQITSNNGSHTLVVSGATLPTMSMWPYPLPASTTVSTYYSGSTSQGAGGASTQTGYTFSLYCVPMDVPAAVAFSELRIGVMNSRSTAGTGSVTHLFSVGFYTNNAGTLSKVMDHYGGIGFSQNSITAQTFKVFTLTTGSNSVAASGGLGGLRSDGTVYSSAGNISANSQMDGAASQVKWVRVDSGVQMTLSANQYYCVLGFCSVSASVNVYSNVGILQSNAISSVNIQDLGRENSTQTSNYLPAWGAISTTFTSVSNAATFFPLPNAIPIANLTMSNSSGQRFHFPFMRNHS